MTDHAPDCIWLIPLSGENLETTWCSDPAPAPDMDPSDAFGPYILATPEALAASPEVAKLVADAEARGMERAAARARVYASNYEQSSDGRNTFILLAEWADTEAAAIRKETP